MPLGDPVFPLVQARPISLFEGHGRFQAADSKNVHKFTIGPLAGSSGPCGTLHARMNRLAIHQASEGVYGPNIVDLQILQRNPDSEEFFQVGQ